MRCRIRLLLLAAVLALAGCRPLAAQRESAGTEKIRVGIVYDVGGRGDLSFNDMAFAGLERAHRQFRGRLETRDLKPAAGGANRAALLRRLAGEGFDLIFGIGAPFRDSIATVAGEFPRTRFALVDGMIPDLTPQSNVVCLLFAEHEGAFLVGAAAALKSTSGVIGFLGGAPVPRIERFEVGYIAGAQFVRPGIRIVSDYVGATDEAFADPVRGKALALAQYDRGADVIFHAAGRTGIGVFEAAVIKRKLAIGVDTDQSLTARQDQRPRILTSMMKRVDVAVWETIRAFAEGGYRGGYRSFGLAEGGVGLAENDFNKEMLAEIKARLEELQARIAAGEIRVPSGKAELDAFLQTLRK